MLFTTQLEIFCNEPWFPRAFVDVHEKIRHARTDDTARKLAATAASLSDLVGTEEAEDGTGAARTHYLYEALRAGGDRAQAIVARCVHDLTCLAEEAPWRRRTLPRERRRQNDQSGIKREAANPRLDTEHVTEPPINSVRGATRPQPLHRYPGTDPGVYELSDSGSEAKKGHISPLVRHSDAQFRQTKQRRLRRARPCPSCSPGPGAVRVPFGAA